MTPAYFAALVALVVYTSSHIAEIVRGSIQAVPRGQGEAADALALSGFQRMWYVVLPQAMRIGIAAARQPVPQPDEELVARRGDQLPRAHQGHPAQRRQRARRRCPSYALLLLIYLGALAA